MNKTITFVSAALIFLASTCMAGVNNNECKDEEKTSPAPEKVLEENNSLSMLPHSLKRQGRGSGYTFGAEGYLNFIGIIGAHSPGIGASFVVNTGEKISGHIGFDYFFPISVEYPVYGNALSSWTMPGSINVTATEKLSIFRLNLTGQYYWVGEIEDDFNFYGLFGVSYFIGSTATSYSSYDKSLYQVPISTDETIVLIYANLGLGAGYKVGPGHIYANMQINLSSGNSRDGFSGPFSYILQSGYRIGF